MTAPGYDEVSEISDLEQDPGRSTNDTFSRALDSLCPRVWGKLTGMRMRNVFRALGLNPEAAFAESPDPKPIQLKKSSKNLRIMLVDDSRDVMELIAKLLYCHFPSARILKFQDGEQAWQELVWQEPDLLISDLTRAGVDGPELLRRLAQRRVKFPVLIISGSSNRWQEEGRLSAGPELRVAFMSKPFDMDEFLAVVERGLGIKSEVAMQPSSAATSTPRPLRIIHVDDEAAVLEVVGLIMRKELKRLDLLQFQHSATAMGVLARCDPDLLITDDRMPWLSGYDIVGRLADRKAAFPIIVTSAWSGTEEWVKEFARRGLRISYLSAPFDIKTFYQHMSHHLGPLE